jgi:hypothetical protein
LIEVRACEQPLVAGNAQDDPGWQRSRHAELAERRDVLIDARMAEVHVAAGGVRDVDDGNDTRQHRGKPPEIALAKLNHGPVAISC